MSDWWQGVEEALEAHSADAPDPWADLPLELPALTDDQRSFIEQIASQLPPIRLSLDADQPDDNPDDNP